MIVKKGHIQFEDVSFAYGDTDVLSQISFEVGAGETVALVGLAEGKSSIINLLPRFYDVGSGQIMIDGQDISKISLHSLRQQMALVSQEAVLFDDTIAANIRFGRPDATAEQVQAAAGAAAADSFIQQFENGYDTIVGATGNPSVRWPAPAYFNSPCDAKRCAYLAIGRSDQRAGCPKRETGSASP